MSKHAFASICAVGMNGEIGKNNDLVFKNKADLLNFKSITIGKPVIMGTKTFESIGSRGLAGRKNFVVTSKYVSDIGYKIRDNAVIVQGFERAVAFAEMYARHNGIEQSFFIGGSAIYAEAFNHITRLYLTEVHRNFDADTFFPQYDKSQWKETSRIENFDFDYVVYDKKI